MTAVPGLNPRTVDLICNECGLCESTAAVTHDDDVVWPLVSALGWSGSPFAAGTHRCTSCSSQTSSASDDGPAREPLHGPSYEFHRHVDIDAVVITPLTEAVEGLRQVLEQAAICHRHVVLDLRIAEVIDSAGLGLIVRVHQEAKQRGGTLTLAAPSRFVLTVLHTMRLDGVFALAVDVPAALDGMRCRR
jgi:anti-sigma B factor antagonist